MILSSFHGKFPVGFAGLAIGLSLGVIHLISIPVDNTSVNPARSRGPALFQAHWALAELWAFILFPIIGGALGALLYLFLTGEVGATLPRVQVRVRHPEQETPPNPAPPTAPPPQVPSYPENPPYPPNPPGGPLA